MKYQVFSENEWIYPDTELTRANNAELYAPRGRKEFSKRESDLLEKDASEAHKQVGEGVWCPENYWAPAL